MDWTNLGKDSAASDRSACSAMLASPLIASSGEPASWPKSCWHICIAIGPACSGGIAPSCIVLTISSSCIASDGAFSASHWPKVCSASWFITIWRIDPSQSADQSSRVNFTIDCRHCFRCASSSTCFRLASKRWGCSAASNERGTAARSFSSASPSLPSRAPSASTPTLKRYSPLESTTGSSDSTFWKLEPSLR